MRKNKKRLQAREKEFIHRRNRERRKKKLSKKMMESKM